MMKRRRQSHDLEKFKTAMAAVTDKSMTITKASEVFGIPRSTLFDRIHGRIKEDCASLGPQTILDRNAEQDLVNHLAFLASLGYGYTRSEVIGMASDLAHYKNLLPKEKSLSQGWGSRFFKRWPNLSCLKPRPTEIYRAKCATPEAMTKYYRNLKEIMDKYSFGNHPENIYNLDETGVTTAHNPQNVIALKNKRPAAVVSGRSSTTTVLACGNAIGNSIPPFLIFKGKRRDETLLEGAIPGTKMALSDSGWSNSQIFIEYLSTHFLQYVNPQMHKLLLYDGHASHINMDVIEWARQHKIVIFLLPPHTSHVSQPLDVGCFGPFKRCLSSHASALMRSRPGTSITRYDLCKLICDSYTQAINNNNLRSSFRKTGIFPFNKRAISKDQLMPSALYSRQDHPQEMSEENSDFFQSKTPSLTPTPTKARKDTTVGGCVITEGRCYQEIKRKNKKFVPPSKKSSTKNQNESQQPGPSGLQRPMSTEPDTEEMDTLSVEDMCCVCKRWQPPKMKRQLKIVEWAQCDVQSCQHWVHLSFCCRETVIRDDQVFFCPHCRSED